MEPNNLRYSTIVRWSEQDAEFVALIPELPGISGVADTAEQAVEEARCAAAAAMQILSEDGRTAPPAVCLSPLSGQLRLRMPPALHRRLADLALLDDVSLNNCLVTLLVEGLERRLPPAQPTRLTVVQGGACDTRRAGGTA